MGPRSFHHIDAKHKFKCITHCCNINPQQQAIVCCGGNASFMWSIFGVKMEEAQDENYIRFRERPIHHNTHQLTLTLVQKELYLYNRNRCVVQQCTSSILCVLRQQRWVGGAWKIAYLFVQKNVQNNLSSAYCILLMNKYNSFGTRSEHVVFSSTYIHTEILS